MEAEHGHKWSDVWNAVIVSLIFKDLAIILCCNELYDCIYNHLISVEKMSLYVNQAITWVYLQNKSTLPHDLLFCVYLTASIYTLNYPKPSK